MAEHKHTPTKKTIENLETNSSKKKKKQTQGNKTKKIQLKNLKKTLGKIYVIPLRKNLTVNLPTSNLNVRN